MTITALRLSRCSSFHHLIADIRYKSYKVQFHPYSSLESSLSSSWNGRSECKLEKKRCEEGTFLNRGLIRLVHNNDATPKLYSSFCSSIATYHTYSNSSWNNSYRVFSTSASTSSDHTSTSSETSPAANRRAKARAFAKKGAKQVRKGGSKMRELFSKYGWYFGGTYFGLHVISFSSIFAAIYSGYLDPNTIVSYWNEFHGSSGGDGGSVTTVGEMLNDEDEMDAVKFMAHLLEKWDITRPYVEKVEQYPQLTLLGVTYIANKFTEPIRVPLSIYITPKVAKAFGKKVVEDNHDNSDEQQLESQEKEEDTVMEENQDENKNNSETIVMKKH